MVTTAMVSVEKKKKNISAIADRFCRRFSLPEIHLATAYFSDAHLVGHGGFGKVYKGEIDNGRETVAIKRLAPDSDQGSHEFLMEIETLSKLRHVNLVSLIGYCNENGEMILVYEYIARGTLADHLYKLARNKDNCLSLTWKQRLDICIGAARGLDYVHTGSSIIHRDVKSTNILLNEDLVARVSDFGLAKHFSNSKSHVSTTVKGTFGYLDPSYFNTCRLTRNSDIYAFGVVLLEVLCGRAAVDLRLGEDEMSLVMWAEEKISKGKVEQIVASNLRAEISADCLKTFVGVAKRCLNRDPKKRPTMAHVVAQLEIALEQQITTHNASRFMSLNAIWNKVKPSGNRAKRWTEKNQKQDCVIPATEEEASDQDQRTIDMHSVSLIPLHELKDITNNFSSKCLIGDGFNGKVYHGVLKSGQVAAIKKPNKKFQTQVSMVSSIKHENVVQLLGYCVDGDQQFFAYEFAQNGSLHNILHGRERGVALSWARRVKIAVEIAQGLEYIHKKGLIHRNINSSNVLIFDNEVAKIADFGLATKCPYNGRLTYRDDHDGRRLTYHDDYYSSFVYYPRDYHSPEYIWLGILSWRCDVYSFGVILLQLLTGSKIVDFKWPSRHHLVTWARPMLSENKVTEIVDARLEGNYPTKAIAKMAAIAALCLKHTAEHRPNMSTVVEALRPLLNASCV